jgi:hypothetical protein
VFTCYKLISSDTENRSASSLENWQFFFFHKSSFRKFQAPYTQRHSFSLQFSSNSYLTLSLKHYNTLQKLWCLMLLILLICDTSVPCQINYVRKLLIQILSIDLFWLLFALTSDTLHLLHVLFQQFQLFVIGTTHISN